MQPGNMAETFSGFFTRFTAAEKSSITTICTMLNVAVSVPIRSTVTP